MKAHQYNHNFSGLHISIFHNNILASQPMYGSSMPQQ
jgi:hypothetical protein